MKKIIIATFLLVTLAVLPFSLQAKDGNWVQQLSEEQFQAMLKYIPPVDYVEPPEDPAVRDRDFPEVFDWREMDGVTPVKSQGQCGSCWAFTAIAVLESRVYIDTGVAPDYSEQQLVDCTYSYSGCQGGDYGSAFNYLMFPGAMTESDYPYQAVGQDCQDKAFVPQVRVTGFEYINSSEESIKAALMDIGPVATVMGANNNLKDYTGGCYQDDSNTQINHGVMIVGWDDTVCPGGSWIVKNSWGSDWGDNGFFYIHRGDVHIGEIPAVVDYEVVPPVSFAVMDYVLDDGNDSVPSAGESATVKLNIENTGYYDATNITARLQCDNPAVTITHDTVTITGIAPKESALTDAFAFSLSDIQPMEALEFTVTLTFDSGDAQTGFTLYSGPIFTVYQNDFEYSGLTDEGWVHGFTHRRDNWERGMHDDPETIGFDPATPHSGEKMWGNNLSKGGSYLVNMSNYLESPVFDCTGMTTVYLSFWRWLTVEEGEFDQARIFVNDTEIWSNPVDKHLIDHYWVHCVYDISDIVRENPLIQVKFTLDSDQGLNFGGWNIDDLRVFSGIDSAFEQSHPDPVKIRIRTSRDVYEANDIFTLTCDIFNYQDALTADEWIILDVFGSYYFAPNWDQTPDSQSLDLPAYSTLNQTILEFEWPEVEGHASDVRFWAALVSPVDIEILDYDMTEWGW